MTNIESDAAQGRGGTLPVERPRTNHPRRRGSDTVAAPAPGSPTPIWISRRTRGVLDLVGLVAIVLLLRAAPAVLTLSLGGATLALVLSFPVRLLSRVVPRGIAMLVTLLLVAGLVVLAFVIVVPILVHQLGALTDAVPGIAEKLGRRGPPLLDWLADRGLLPQAPEQFVEKLRQDVLESVQDFGGELLGGLGQFVAGAVNTVVTLFGIVFVAIYLLSDARRVQATVLWIAPRSYRRDVRDLWNAFGFTLSRYLGGLALSLAIQGVLSAVALYFLGVPYAILLGAWVSVTALIPFLGAWIGAVPAVLLALTVSPTTALLTGGLFLLIQQLEGNVLTPRIQGQAVRVHPVLVFLAVIAGGELFGIAGVVFAVPAVAVVRVLFDFFLARLRTIDKREQVTTRRPA
ncbi:MAG: AI-2E family transporter [Gemmatimonadaceae bacterium]